MPLYEYQCDQCAERFERIQKFSDPPVTACPVCGGGPVRKLISSPAIQFKGSGWYITDYARSGSPDKGEGTGDAAKKSGDTAASKDKAASSEGAAGASSASADSSSGKASESAKPASPATSGTKP